MKDKGAFPITAETVCASAPGKVILFGEHAVVYGHKAIAAALSDLRIFVWITPLDCSSLSSSSSQYDPTIRIQLPDLPCPIDFSLPCRSLRRQTDDDDDLNNMPSSCWTVPPLANETAATIARHFPNQSDKNNNNNHHSTSLLDDFSITALTPILYLFKVIMDDDSDLTTGQIHKGRSQPAWYERDWQIHVRSQDLPVGAGLGSSAAFSVAMAAALLRLKHCSSNNNTMSDDTTTTLSTSKLLPDLDTVNKYAYYAEILLHGHPSGLDNAVATYGGALQFHKTVATGEIHLQPLPHFHQLSMLLVHTHIPRSTKALVAKVRALWEKYPTVVNPILAAMGEIATAFSEEQNESTPSSSSSSSSESLLDWVRLNHALLRAVGVSHVALDTLVRTVEECSQQAAAAKLTGAGGGGCALVVWSTEKAREQVLGTLQRPEHSHYSCFSSTVGGHGVQWHEDTVSVFHEHSTSSFSTNKAYVSTRWGTWLVSRTAAIILTGASIATIAIVSTISRKRR